jgi:hypothetical protein
MRPLAVASVCGFLLLASSSKANQNPSAPMALLEIRTSKWHYFLLDGAPLGYAPIAVEIAPGRRHVLSWTSAESKGSKFVEVDRQKTLRLDDRDFSH